jgi:GMP synthase-like glutamine amidotransferase
VKPILLVRNDPFESFGVAAPSLARAGADLVTADLPGGAELPPLDAVSAVVVFGGTVNVDQVAEHPYLAAIRTYTRETLERGIPYLGICLGSQILARALDVPVAPGPLREVGFEAVRATDQAKEDRLLSFLGEREMVLHWHEDTHELPPGAALLVTNDEIPVQAYRVGERGWGIQFHLEVDAAELDWWLDVADAQIDIEAVWGKSARQIRDEAIEHMAAQEERGREIFRRFAAIAREDADR